MKQRLTLLVLLVSIFCLTTSAQNKIQVYNPDANARDDLKIAISKAKAENKHVLIQIGGNWCPWCIKLHNFIKDNESIDSLLHADYIPVKMNYDKKTRDFELLKELGFPQRFGFPVLVVLDADGNRLHTQNTVYLEEGKGYDANNITNFLKAWNPAALDPKTYK